MLSKSNSRHFEYDIYLSGPILSIGQIHDNISAFQEWSRKLRGMGYTVFSPPEDEPVGLEWADYLRRDIQALARCKMVAVLPNWDRSKGAGLEVYIARQLGMEVVSVEDMKPKKSDDEVNQELRQLAQKKLAEAGGCMPEDDQSTTDPIRRETVLEEAMRLVTKERGNAYGPPEQDFERTALMWNGLFKDLLKDGMQFKPEHVGLAMIALKLSRAMWSENRDNFVDIPGYAACVHRIIFGSW